MVPTIIFPKIYLILYAKGHKIRCLVLNKVDKPLSKLLLGSPLPHPPNRMSWIGQKPMPEALSFVIFGEIIVSLTGALWFFAERTSLFIRMPA